jgi:putative peptidoglycan lipid II flippase
MSGHASRGDHDALRNDLSASLRVIGLLLAFSCVALIVAANPFSAIFSKTLADTHAMAAVLIAYLVGLLPFSIVFVLQRVFYALEDTRTPFLFQSFQSVLLVGGMLISATLARPDIAFGVAVSTTVADYALMLVAAILLRRRLGRLGAAPVIRSYLIFFIALVPAAAAGIGLDAALGAFSGGFAVSATVPAVVSVAVVGAGMAVVYAGGLLVLRAPELTDLARPILRRLHLVR